MRTGQGACDVRIPALPVEKRQQVGIDLSVEQCVECFRNKEHQPVVDRPEFELRCQRRSFDQAPVGIGPSERSRGNRQPRHGGRRGHRQRMWPASSVPEWDSTTCQSWLTRERNTPAKLRR